LPNSAMATLHQKLHEGGGRPVGSPHTPGDVQEVVVIDSVWYGSDGRYVRVRRQGQTGATGVLRWCGAKATAPVPEDKAILVKPLGSMNLGWVLPNTTAAS